MKVAVVSLKFSPGHVAHLYAYKELFSLITDEVEMFLVPEYEHFMKGKSSISYTKDIQAIIDSKPDCVFMYNISIHNISLAKKCKENSIRSVYVLHEPRCSFRELLAEGNDILKTIAANFISSSICRNVDKVLLASETGKNNYERYMLECNTNYAVFPLIFVDEYENEKNYNRQFFSFIGGFTDVHACKEFLSFMEYGLTETKDLRFLIATKTEISSFLQKALFQDAIKTGRLIVQAGRPMTTEEINAFYRQSICVWNAYNRSTQSGVLPNALMQGTPVIVNEKGEAKNIMNDNTVGCFINMPPDNGQLLESFRFIQSHLKEMEENARNVFLNQYCYSRYVELAKNIILS